ncbi:hypothetical protein DMB95_08860 [Campylobacter sp. MIT 12-8780]|uniref:hypothetical protein n=1 Tax=unclassified Campylobacter TaxID=2593542 RepID=UPI00115F16E3|nr:MULTISPECIES: hypothetical protein [unclassified Campylobacter]NDJ27937.1 hypothetical protein [Campylobacter sp. MIT 19-121]TQR40131.1 hypothetical protein DMB95_08860 [Campylobacter sp. MIT 12-8780]
MQINILKASLCEADDGNVEAQRTKGETEYIVFLEKVVFSNKSTPISNEEAFNIVEDIIN